MLRFQDLVSRGMILSGATAQHVTVREETEPQILFLKSALVAAHWTQGIQKFAQILSIAHQFDGGGQMGAAALATTLGFH